ncbi:MAG: hypothetical protein ABF759_12395 [Acetobacter malorum]|uniref:hypothetical protein n=1 Tax=Acetobacter malorum TaxID=178901 RepID=UPI0039EC81D2
MIDSHENNHAAGDTMSQANDVQVKKLGIPEIEAQRFDQDTSASGLAVNCPHEDGRSFTAEMLKIMLADCRSDLEKTQAELRQIEPVKALLAEKVNRLQILDEGIMDLIRHCCPKLVAEYASKTAADLGRETRECAAKASLQCLLLARSRAFPECG